MTEQVIDLGPVTITIGEITVRLGLGLGLGGTGSGGTPVTPSTWNPADKSAGMTLSGGNLTWYADNAFGNYRGVRSTQSKASGKKYYEATCAAAASLGACGFANASQVLSAGPGQSTNSVAFYDNGNAAYNSANTTLVSYTTADIIGCAIDIGAALVWFRKNGTWLNSGDPATGVNGISVPGIGSTVFAYAGTWVTDNSSQTVNFGATAFTYAAPSGFSAWDT